MSGPVQPDDLDRAPRRADPPPDGPAAEAAQGPVEVREGRRTSVGGLDIVRVLPTKGRRTVGPWCFVDCMNPPDALDPDPMEVGPHPHTGLSTVTWLLEGEAVHGDSLGTEQPIRPGQLNLMTAGHGIAHAELGRAGEGVRGIQMWVAQPERTRHGPAAFEHHADLPVLDLPAGRATVLMGGLAGTTSPARTDTPLVGAQLDLRPGRTTLPAPLAFEHAVVPFDAPVLVGGAVVEPGWLAYIPAGPDHLHIEVRDLPTQLMLLGGEPFERIAMWWNFVARDQAELTAAYEAWRDRDADRFGEVPSDLERIEAPPPPWVRSR